MSAPLIESLQDAAKEIGARLADWNAAEREKQAERTQALREIAASVAKRDDDE